MRSDAPNQWHIEIADAPSGPTSEGQIAKLLVAGDITPESRVWNPSMPKWVELKDSSLAGALGLGFMPNPYINKKPESPKQEKVQPAVLPKRRPNYLLWLTILNAVITELAFINREPDFAFATIPSGLILAMLSLLLELARRGDRKQIASVLAIVLSLLLLIGYLYIGIVALMIKSFTG